MLIIPLSEHQVRGWMSCVVVSFTGIITLVVMLLVLTMLAFEEQQRVLAELHDIAARLNATSS